MAASDKPAGQPSPNGARYEHAGRSLPVRPLDSANYYSVVGRVGGRVSVRARLTKNLTPAQAVNLAAWLVTIADPDEKEFRRVREEILK